ncbi:MAG: hypothetical protein ABI704_11860 [Kofleriaceae bacterium]
MTIAVALVGCGKIAAAPDAAIDAGLPAPLTCTGAEVACGSNCADPMTSSDHCGSCDISCQAGRETCVAGHCADFFTSCASIHTHDSTQTSGFYALIDSTNIYCDMEDGGIGLSGLSFDNYNTATPVAGMAMVTLTDLQNAPTQKAFVALYNRQSGSLPLLQPPMDVVNNCCIKVSTNANLTLLLGAGGPTQPATVGPAGPINCAASYTVALSFGSTVGPVFPGTAMAADFFVTHAPTEVAQCSDGNNPAFWWKKVMP